MRSADIAAASLFVLVYGIRLAYQGVLLRGRRAKGSQVGWSELLLVIIPKNALVMAAAILLFRGVAWNIVTAAGWLLFLAGIAFRLVALHQLGPMYSLNIETSQDSQLITKGVYGIVRHPLYLAYAVDTIGIALMLQRWYPWLVVACVILGWAIRIRREEEILRQTFGHLYEEYSSRVPSFNIVAWLVRRVSPKEKPHGSLTGDDDSDELEMPNGKSSLSDKEKSEIEVHLAEYEALSHFQREAKTIAVRIAMYHNTGIVIVAAWLVQNSTDPKGIVSSLASRGYLAPLLFALPLLNSVLMIACEWLYLVIAVQIAPGTASLTLKTRG